LLNLAIRSVEAAVVEGKGLVAVDRRYINPSSGQDFGDRVVSTREFEHLVARRECAQQLVKARLRTQGRRILNSRSHESIGT